MEGEMKYWTFFLATMIAISISSCCSPCEEDGSCEEADCSVYLAYEGGTIHREYFCIRGIPNACTVTFRTDSSRWYNLSRCGEDSDAGHCIILDNPSSYRVSVFDNRRRSVDLSACEFHPDEEIWWEEEEVFIELE